MSKVAFIHALAQAIAPVDDEMDRTWPRCERLHLRDESVIADPVLSSAEITERFTLLANYAVSAGAQGILFTCSAFGANIEEVARGLPDRPVLTPNEAMITEAVQLGGRIGLVATFAPTLRSMLPEFPAAADVRTTLAEGALEALQTHDVERHDALVAAAARRLAAEDCAVIVLAQFSMARSAAMVHQAVGRPVLSPVASAVCLLKKRLGHV